MPFSLTRVEIKEAAPGSRGDGKCFLVY